MLELYDIHFLFYSPPFKLVFHLRDFIVQVIKTFCEHIERERTKTMNSLKKKYAGIGPLILMIERLIKGSNSGRAKRMTDYYHHWEHKVLDSLLKMLLR